MANRCEWDVEIVKSADQVATNTASLNDSELFTPVAANAFYRIELLLLYSGNDATGDYAWFFTHPNITGSNSIGMAANFNATLVNTLSAISGSVTQFPSAVRVCGTGALNELLVTPVRFTLRTVGNAGTLQFVFGNAVPAVGRTATTRAGTTLRLKRIA